MADDDLRVLGNRYEIHQRLARGGMAQVYLARDSALDRPVAVKELVPEFATDPSFVERFRREAQAAANLAHPNIVGVYDWGTQDGTYYIVMEYVDGPSLSQVIRRDGPLHPRRAAEIASEVASALGFAHSRGVVHRDVKPGNVLLTSTGQSKVTDFGIARALSSSDEDLTQAGSVMGTATYFSPEQAQGLPVDPRTDLYSLGVVLYEMVTGRPPFSGDTPLAIAYKHVQDRPAPPSTAIPDLPPALEAVIMKCLQKKPDDRYASAEELRADLNRFLAGEATSAQRAVGAAVAGAAVGAGVGAAGAATTIQSAVDDPGHDYAEPYEYEEEDRERSRTGLFLGILAVLLLLLGGLLFWFASSLNSGEVSVPAVIGETREAAERTLTDLGFEVEVTERSSDTVESGLVMDQDPKQGTEAEKGSTVKLVVSTGQELVAVPDVVGRTEAEARFILKAEGLNFRIESVDDAEAAPGTVISQSPAADEQVAPGTEVVLQVSKGPGEELVPDVSGQSLNAAQAELQAAGFKTTSRQEPSDTVPAGQVISTDPAAGASVPRGQTVTIIVSSGVEQVAVPSVIGQTESSALSTLRNEGFEVKVETTPLPAGDTRDGRVTAQNPGAGVRSPKGSTVTITVGQAAAPTTTTTSTTTTSTTSP